MLGVATVAPPDAELFIEPLGTEATAPSREQRWTRLTLLALLIVTIIGAIIRARGFASTGLFDDDAWVALSSKVGLGTARHMWVTAAGYGFAERLWIILGSKATWSFQLPQFVCGVAAIPAVFFLALYFKLGRVAALLMAVVVCTSPVCVVYSTRIKEYPADFLLSCLLLALAEAARRRPDVGPLVWLALASAVGFLISSSVGVVVAGVWVALALLNLRDGAALRRVLAIGAVTALVCGSLVVLFYSNFSPTLHQYWTDYFIKYSSLNTFARTIVHSAKNLLVPNLFGLPSSLASALALCVVLLCAALSVVALLRNRAMLGPALVVLAAFGASVAHVIPLGTGRTDEYLYPPLLLLVAVGASHVLALVDAAIGRTSVADLRVPLTAALGVVLVLVAAVLLGHGYDYQFKYPGSDVTKLAAKLHREERPGDQIFVSHAIRYQWAYYEDTPLRVELVDYQDTGFTVLSTNPNVFITPHKDDVKEAKAMAAKDARVWYVWIGQKSRDNSASYNKFLSDGWQAVLTVHAHLCSATLLVSPRAQSTSP